MNRMTIAIYSRKSKFTGKGDSIANQIELCKQRAQQFLSLKNISEENTKILIYEDEGFSGKNTVRPEFQKLLAAVKSNEINCVICYKLDRISRNVGDFAQTYETFEKHKVDFLCAGETYDTTTPAGRAMMGMVSVFAQMEREVTAERIRDNMHMLARSGRWLGGHTPTGFQSHKEERVDVDGKIRSLFKLVPVKKELELVEFIYQKFIELQSISGTTRYLIKNNLRTKNGNDFTNVAVKAILRNPVYCIAGQEAADFFRSSGADICFEEDELDNKQGFMPYNRTSSGKDQQIKNEIKDWLIAVGNHDGIIQSDTWVKIQKILDAKREKIKSIVRTPYKSEALLSGILVCGNCNRAMRPHVHKNRKSAEGIIPYYYICELKERSSKERCDMCNANGAVIDNAIMDELLNYERTDSSIHKSLLELKERLANKKESENNQLGFLESELETKQKQIDRLLDALGADESNAQETFVELTRQKINALADQCKALKNEIEKASLNNAIYTDYESQTQAVVDTLKKLKDTMLTTTAVEKRELLKSTVERIVWDGEKAYIFLLGE
ncbi:MAG: recombinase family protein [Defluviitaleaceae bacterium]|nr:recombinase family protein [Defluviitaleaceae bacterium]